MSYNIISWPVFSVYQTDLSECLIICILHLIPPWAEYGHSWAILSIWAITHWLCPPQGKPMVQSSWVYCQWLRWDLKLQKKCIIHWEMPRKASSPSTNMEVLDKVNRPFFSLSCFIRARGSMKEKAATWFGSRCCCCWDIMHVSWSIQGSLSAINNNEQGAWGWSSELILSPAVLFPNSKKARVGWNFQIHRVNANGTINKQIWSA